MTYNHNYLLTSIDHDKIFLSLELIITTPKNKKIQYCSIKLLFLNILGSYGTTGIRYTSLGGPLAGFLDLDSVSGLVRISVKL